MLHPSQMHRSGGEFNQNYLGSPSQTIQVVCLISCPEDSRMGTVAGRSLCLCQTVRTLRTEMVSYFSVTVTGHGASHIQDGGVDGMNEDLEELGLKL